MTAGTSGNPVPAGTTVKFVTECTARFISSAAPPGGEHFDGILNPGDRFQFVPGVAGTWEFFDQVGGATGTLTAQ